MNESAVQASQSRFHGGRCPMRSLNGLLGLGVALISAGCANPIRVYSYHGPAMQFDSTAETFGWLAVPPDENQRQIREQYASIDKQFRSLITEALTARGYVESDAGPDVWLEYRFGRRVIGNAAQPAREQRYALIAFDVLEPDNLKLIWRSSAHVLIDPSVPAEDIRDLLRRTVDAMLKAVPSRPGAR